MALENLHWTDFKCGSEPGKKRRGIALGLITFYNLVSWGQHRANSGQGGLRVKIFLKLMYFFWGRKILNERWKIKHTVFSKRQKLLSEKSESTDWQFRPCGFQCLTGAILHYTVDGWSWLLTPRNSSFLQQVFCFLFVCCSYCLSVFLFFFLVFY